MNRLQKALFLNALFSGISGLILIVLHESVARLFETDNITVFWIIGVALVYFAGTIVYEYKKQRPLFVKLIIAQDFIWVIGSIVILIWQPFAISTVGHILIGIIAFIVLFMGVNQLKALFTKVKR